MKRKSKKSLPEVPPEQPYPECIGCEHYGYSGRYGSVVHLYGVDGKGNELEKRVKCKQHTHYCRHPEAKLYEFLAPHRHFCISKNKQ